MRKYRQVLITAVLLAAVAASCGPGAQPPAPAAGQGAAREENHYSPAEDLERIDVRVIDGARQTLDIAMYAFTDRYVAEAVVRAARRGVKVRIYRDRQQFDDEQRKTSARNSSSSSDLFRGEANIQLRVKSSHELMHLKAFLADHAILRDGSANWSPTGLKRQDNNLRLSADAAQIEAFVHTFEAMWARNNEVVQ